jgi:hypothetical protein
MEFFSKFPIIINEVKRLSASSGGWHLSHIPWIASVKELNRELRTKNQAAARRTPNRPRREPHARRLCFTRECAKRLTKFVER